MAPSALAGVGFGGVQRGLGPPRRGFQGGERPLGPGRGAAAPAHRVGTLSISPLGRGAGRQRPHIAWARSPYPPWAGARGGSARTSRGHAPISSLGPGRGAAAPAAGVSAQPTTGRGAAAPAGGGALTPRRAAPAAPPRRRGGRR